MSGVGRECSVRQAGLWLPLAEALGSALDGR